MPPFIARPARPLLLAVALLAAAAHAQEGGAPAGLEAPKELAPGFTTRPAGSRLLVLPADIELFSMSAGGVVEPREDWTIAAQKNFVDALHRQEPKLGKGVIEMDEAQADEFSEITNLHRAVADAISMHHKDLKLATKGDRLDWSLGDAVRPLKERSGADYALFTWIRDSYASGERKAAMVALAMLGAVSLGGEQVGYASLVDLNTGRVVWFNQLNRMSGDLREPQPATETVETLLKGFPAVDNEARR